MDPSVCWLVCWSVKISQNGREVTPACTYLRTFCPPSSFREGMVLMSLARIVFNLVYQVNVKVLSVLGKFSMLTGGKTF